MDACQMTSDIMDDAKNALALLTLLAFSGLIVPFVPCKKSLCTFCTICTIAGESAESANSAMQKFTLRIVRNLRNLTFLSANFYTGIACRAMDDVRRNAAGKKIRLREKPLGECEVTPSGMEREGNIYYSKLRP